MKVIKLRESPCISVPVNKIDSVSFNEDAEMMTAIVSVQVGMIFHNIYCSKIDDGMQLYNRIMKALIEL